MRHSVFLAGISYQADPKQNVSSIFHGTLDVRHAKVMDKSHRLFSRVTLILITKILILLYL